LKNAPLLKEKKRKRKERNNAYIHIQEHFSAAFKVSRKCIVLLFSHTASRNHTMKPVLIYGHLSPQAHRREKTRDIYHCLRELARGHG
jgi:hypothetical protein